jgi:hypothetical protein
MAGSRTAAPCMIDYISERYAITRSPSCSGRTRQIERYDGALGVDNRDVVAVKDRA